MDLDEFYPSPDKLIESEVEVLGFLRNEPYMKRVHVEFSLDAHQGYQRYRSNWRSGFAFASFLDVSHLSMPRNSRRGRKRGALLPNVRLVVSALVELEMGQYSNVSYCLAVLRIRDRQLTILRKFHFDVTPAAGGTVRRRQEHPRCHLQYGGSMTPFMSKMGCKESHLTQMHASLSEPRILFWPMSLGLVIDMALHEFPDSESSEFRRTPEWRGMVRRQERLVLRDFYAKCVAVVDNSGGKYKTLGEEFYVV